MSVPNEDNRLQYGQSVEVRDRSVKSEEREQCVE